MKNLNDIVNVYLEKNGIQHKFFADYIGCEYSKCNKWLNGQRKLNMEQIRKTYEFLQGDFLKSVDDILAED